ncbi:MAG: hypothetical protein SNJ57_19425 [Cyanobacteriota bacterium]
MSRRNRQQKRNITKRDITFPLTVRQAQKLAGNPAVKIDSLVEAVGVAVCDRQVLSKRLAQMAALDPSALIEAPEEYDYDGAENYDYDFEFEFEEEEEAGAGADSPSAEAQPAAVENREAGESRPKDTDEVAPQSAADPSEESDRHGGDGNSGECDAPAKTDPQEQKAQSQADGSAQPVGQGQGSGDPQGLPGKGGSDRDADWVESGSEPGGNPTSEGDRSPEKSQSSARQPAPSPSTALGDGEERPDELLAPMEGDQPRDAGAQESGDSQTPNVSDAPEQSGEGDRGNHNPEGTLSDERTNPSDGAEYGLEDAQEAIENGVGEDALQDILENQPGDDRPTHQKKWGKKFGKAEKSQLSASGNDNHGGVTAELKKIGVDAKLLKLCRQRLAALVGDSSQDYSPRRDYTEFCVRLKTYRNPLPARREEQGRPVILVMADVSASCSSFSEQSVAVAKAASKLGVPGADVLVLSHSNGYPEDLEHNGKAVLIEFEKIWDSSVMAWYDTLTNKFQIQTVIALGDWDAVSEYAYLAQHPTVERLIWLDNAYCSSRGTVQDRSKWAIAQLCAYGYAKPALIRHKLTYRDGCKDAIAFINNIY